MDVANPIYDVVFTYLMQNQRVARLLIGRITGLAVQSLTVSPQGTALRRTPEDPEHDLPLTLLRMTFAARVQTRDGSERQVLIEILKANSPTVIKRFLRYLDQQIGSGENILTYPSGRTEAVPIVTICRSRSDRGPTNSPSRTRLLTEPALVRPSHSVSMGSPWPASVYSELMPEYASRRIYGAVAYLKAYQESDVRAERLGLFVIRHRQQRQHHQPGGVHAAHVRSPEHGTEPPPGVCRICRASGKADGLRREKGRDGPKAEPVAARRPRQATVLGR